jgi:riboflavin synthase
VFTGIIEEIGTVVEATGDALTIAARTVLSDLRVADSIAVNGVCLTVVARTAATFSVELMPETLRRTNLGDLRPGDGVNLERPVPVGGRLGGHIVQGHVDGTGPLLAKEPEGNALLVTIGLPPDLARYVVPKGFIAVDGVSLTVVEAAADRFTVALIPFTQAHITLPRQPIGYRANLEVDILAKYVERLLLAGPWRPGGK